MERQTSPCCNNLSTGMYCSIKFSQDTYVCDLLPRTFCMTLASNIAQCKGGGEREILAFVHVINFLFQMLAR